MSRRPQAKPKNLAEWLSTESSLVCSSRLSMDPGIYTTEQTGLMEQILHQHVASPIRQPCRLSLVESEDPYFDNVQYHVHSVGKYTLEVHGPWTVEIEDKGEEKGVFLLKMRILTAGRYVLVARMDGEVEDVVCCSSKITLENAAKQCTSIDVSGVLWDEYTVKVLYSNGNPLDFKLLKMSGGRCRNVIQSTTEGISCLNFEDIRGTRLHGHLFPFPPREIPCHRIPSALECKGLEKAVEEEKTPRDDRKEDSKNQSLKHTEIISEKKPTTPGMIRSIVILNVNFGTKSTYVKNLESIQNLFHNYIAPGSTCTSVCIEPQWNKLYNMRCIMDPPVDIIEISKNIRDYNGRELDENMKSTLIICTFERFLEEKRM